jgi:hypothetical protein
MHSVNKLDGCYTKLLRYALNYKLSDQLVLLVTAWEVSEQSSNQLLLWDHTKVVLRCKCAKVASTRQLVKAIRKVEGQVTSDKEVGKLMLEREAWRSRISMVMILPSNSGRCRTRSVILVVEYYYYAPRYPLETRCFTNKAASKQYKLTAISKWQDGSKNKLLLNKMVIASAFYWWFYSV